PKNNGTTCNDGSYCTPTDSCQNGMCQGQNPIMCLAQDQCHVAGTCNSQTGVCSNPTKTEFVPANGPCTSDTDCSNVVAGYICRGGTCYSSCNDNIGCTASGRF